MDNAAIYNMQLLKIITRLYLGLFLVLSTFRNTLLSQETKDVTMLGLEQMRFTGLKN